MPEQDISGLGGIQGPSDETWVPTSAFPSAPGSNGQGTGQSAVLGTNQLQKAIDEFNSAVTKLDKIVQQMAGNGFSGNAFGSSGGQKNSNGGGATFGGRPTRAGYGIPGATDNESPIGPRTPSGGFSGHSYVRGQGDTNNSGGNGSGFLGKAASFGGKFGILPTGTYSLNPNSSDSSSGGGSGSGYGGQYANGNGGYASSGSGSGSGGAGGNGGGGSSSGSGGMGTFGTALSAVGSMASGLTTMGRASLPAQQAMSSMVQQGTLLAPAGVANAQASSQMRNAAFGGGGQPTNNFAYNAQDAAAGYGILQQMSGSYLPSSNSAGRAGLGAAASFAGANPNMSYTEAAQMAQTMYMPQASLQMRQLGYGVSPLNMGTGTANSPGSVIQSMMQRWYGSSSTSASGLAAALAPGQVGYTNLQQLGYSGQSLQDMVSTMEAYNKVVSGSKGKISDQQVQQLFQQAQGGNKQALSTLNKYGVTQSDVSAAKDVNAQKTEGQNDIYSSFTSGLDGAATALGKFQSILNKIVSMPGVNQLVGGGMGALGGGSSMLGNVAGGAELAGGAALMGKLLLGKGGGSVLTKLLGKGAGGAAGTGEAAATSESATTAAAAGGGAGAATLGILGGGVAGSALSAFLSGKAGQAAGRATGTSKTKNNPILQFLLTAGSAMPGGAATDSFLGSMFGQHSLFTSTDSPGGNSNSGMGTLKKLLGPILGFAKGTSDVGAHTAGSGGKTASTTAPPASSVDKDKSADSAGRSVIDSLNKSNRVTPKQHLPRSDGPEGDTSQTTVKAATGNVHVIPGYNPGVDDVDARLSRGEAVLNPRAVKALGHANLDMLNRDFPVMGGQTQYVGGVLHAASGAQILSDAKKYNGHRYVYGGPSNPQDGWDCSSFASYVLGHDLNMPLPGGTWASTTNKGQAHGDTADQFARLPGAHKVSSNAKDIQAGDILVWKTHVGFGVGPGTMFSAYDTAKGTLQTPKDLKNAGGPSGEQLTIYRVGSGGGSAGSSSSSGKSSTSSGGSGMPAQGATYTATSEAANVTAALGGGSGGVDLGVSTGSSGSQSSGSGSSGGSSAPAGGATGSDAANGKELYQYLLTNLFSGDKIAAAGATASIGGESGYNPEAQGTGGRGLIGWTPPSKISDATFKGGMKTQLPAIIDFVKQNNDMGVISQMKAAQTVLAAANLWGKGVERYGINDVHANYVQEAASWAGLSGSQVGLSTGGSVNKAGPYIVGERGPEAVYLPEGSSVSSAKRTQIAGAQGVAQVPWSASAGMLAGSAAGGVTVHLNFDSGAIQISQGSGSSAGSNGRDTAANSAREIVSKVAEMLKSEDIYSTIRSGNKWG